MNLAVARKLNLTLSAIGATVFAALFLYVTVAPANFDNRVRDFAMARVQTQIENELGNHLQPETYRKASRLAAAVSGSARQVFGRLGSTAAGEMVSDRYHQVMDRLHKDVKIFSATSFLALIFAFALALLRGKAARHLLPISLSLSVSTLLAGLWYVFGQDWVLTILFGDYWGWTYGAVLSVLTVLMIDIAINKARLTSALLDAIGGLFGATISYAPC